MRSVGETDGFMVRSGHFRKGTLPEYSFLFIISYFERNFHRYRRNFTKLFIVHIAARYKLRDTKIQDMQKSIRQLPFLYLVSCIGRALLRLARRVSRISSQNPNLKGSIHRCSPKITNTYCWPSYTCRSCPHAPAPRSGCGSRPAAARSARTRTRRCCRAPRRAFRW